jgi:hypothetical protein
MDFNLNHKNNDFSTIFSRIHITKKNHRYSHFQNNLSELQQNVTLLKFYATKGNLSKKNKIMPSPKPLQTEEINRAKTIKKLIKNNINIGNKALSESRNKSKNNKEDMKKIDKSSNESQLNNSKNTKNKIFMTNFDHKSKSKNNNKIAPNISYKNNYTISNDKSNLLPPLSRTNFNPNFSNDISYLRTSKKDEKSSSKNKSSTHNKSKTLEKEEFPKVNSMIKDMKKENNTIKKKLNKGIEKFNIMEWYMRTRFKYTEYKYGIAEIDKYFMDLKAYGKPEEDEIEKRKTFYQHVEDVIDDIHQVQQQKEIEKLNKKYGIDQDNKKITKSKKGKKEFNLPQQKQMVELSRALKEIAKRKKKEKNSREEIGEILEKCKQRLHSINSFEKKLPKNLKKINQF